MADETARLADNGASLASPDSPFENLALHGGSSDGAGEGRTRRSRKARLGAGHSAAPFGRARTHRNCRSAMSCDLGRGSMVELDRGPGAPLDVRVNGVLIGRGEVVVVNEEKLGLRFVEVVSQARTGQADPAEEGSALDRDVGRPVDGALLTTVIVAGPFLAVVMSVGMVVSLFQALTQINEMTLSFVPKFLGTALVLALLGPVAAASA